MNEGAARAAGGRKLLSLICILVSSEGGQVISRAAVIHHRPGHTSTWQVLQVYPGVAHINSQDLKLCF